VAQPSIVSFDQERLVSRSRAVVGVAVLAFAGVVSGCGGGGSAVSGPTKKCVSLWNESSNRAKGVVTLLSNDLSGTPAGLVQVKQHGRCKVVFGAIGSSYVFGVYFYQPAKRTYVEKQTLEGPGRTWKLPPWNAKLNEDGTLTLGRP
jgi:hypothetical protein